ncbi:MAG: hypothetical protein K6347_07870 [Campylobacterales bacterium]
MKIDFKKITPLSKEFSFEREVEGGKISFSGTFKKGGAGIALIDGHLKGEIELICDLTGEPFIYHVDEEVAIRATDGIRKGDDPDYDTIEFFDGYVDFDEIFYSEIEAIRQGYHAKPDAIFRDISY